MNTLRSYWLKNPPPGHDARLTPWDVREMQIIDADCNDCRHFKRGAMLQKQAQMTVFAGHCLKFDRPTKAYPTNYSGHDCFEHRKTEAEVLNQ